ncbi:hypothetical protein [Dyadobacter endophyticus]|uniref:hypothetical protein n=1 Tax=Dyadobacter endophyticus TaxID=1749036 RepID=UPI00166BDD08|nr:hypothetical protein [Dyadobacter endophyticus]
MYLNCKIILFDYQHQIGDIIHFFREKIDAYLPDDFGDHDLKDCVKSLVSNRIYVNMQIAIDLLMTTPRVFQRKKRIDADRNKGGQLNQVDWASQNQCALHPHRKSAGGEL